MFIFYLKYKVTLNIIYFDYFDSKIMEILLQKWEELNKKLG